MRNLLGFPNKGYRVENGTLSLSGLDKEEYGPLIEQIRTKKIAPESYDRVMVQAPLISEFGKLMAAIKEIRPTLESVVVSVVDPAQISAVRREATKSGPEIGELNVIGRTVSRLAARRESEQGSDRGSNLG